MVVHVKVENVLVVLQLIALVAVEVLKDQLVSLNKQKNQMNLEILSVILLLINNAPPLNVTIKLDLIIMEAKLIGNTNLKNLQLMSGRKSIQVVFLVALKHINLIEVIIIIFSHHFLLNAAHQLFLQMVQQSLIETWVTHRLIVQ